MGFAPGFPVRADLPGNSLNHGLHGVTENGIRYYASCFAVHGIVISFPSGQLYAVPPAAFQTE